MKKVKFITKKWLARALVAVGSAIGLTSCFLRMGHKPIECVYGPPPGKGPSIEVIEDVYGPPIEDIENTNDTIMANDSVAEINDAKPSGQ